MSEQLDRIERNVNEWAYMILAAIFGGIITVLGPHLSESVFAVAAFLLSVLIVVFCASMSFAYGSNGYNRRFWKWVGISPRYGWVDGND